MKSYTLSQALTLLENGYFHEVAYVSANRNKNEGGKIARIDRCRINPHHQQTKPNSYVTSLTPAAEQNKKTANHKEHATRNLMLENGEIRKAHIHLIFSLNQTQII